METSDKEQIGRVALVTGASYGLGRAITEELLARGARVMLADVIDRLAQTTSELKVRGYEVDSVFLDVTDRASVARAIAATHDQFGRMDVFVNNAGWSKVMKPILQLTQEDWDTYMAINVRGNLYCLQEAATYWISNETRGRFVAIASTAAVKPYHNAAGYCTSKSAIPMLMKSAALELGQHGITVNCVAPGPTTTETNLAHANGQIDPALGEAKRQREALIPLGKNDPADIATAVAYFASPQARRVTGQMLVVEGGGQLIS